MDAKPKNTILIVEDEIPLQKVVGFKLEKAGFSTVTARSVEQALDLLRSDETIKLIWLDHYLIGKETGLDLVNIIKKDKTYRAIPIFVVTNSSNNNIMHTYLKFGIDKFFIKAELKLDDVVVDISKTLKLK